MPIQTSVSVIINRPPTEVFAPLEALKDTTALLIVATGHGQTEALRKSYPQDNIIIEDFVDFD